MVLPLPVKYQPLGIRSLNITLNSFLYQDFVNKFQRAKDAIEYARRSAAESAAATVSKRYWNSSFVEFAQKKKLLNFWWYVKPWNILSNSRQAYFTRHLMFFGPKCGSSIGHCLATCVQSWVMQLGNQLSNCIHCLLMNSYLQWIPFKYKIVYELSPCSSNRSFFLSSVVCTRVHCLCRFRTFNIKVRESASRLRSRLH